ncbi:MULTISPECIES: hypothetical protein [unclassified Nocardiopsis]|uniref:hypothetical protein n=1 Tax=unclassified Nocardiopsis TaxID=2649073 RepID=UPI00135852AF|nr:MULTISPECIES: hypothetical protein [unclassified Nocardiopsis]
MSTPLEVFLSEEEADAERLDETTGRLRRELLELDVEDVCPLRGAAPPPGARAFGVVEAGALLVTLGQSAAALRQVIEAIRDWRNRSRTRPTIRLVIDGDVLEISDASPEHVSGSFELFVARHTTARAEP